MNEQRTKRIVTILASMLIGALLFIFGITLSHNQIVIDTVYFIISNLVFIAALMSSKVQYKNTHDLIYLYLLIIDVLLIAMTIIYMLINHL